MCVEGRLSNCEISHIAKVPVVVLANSYITYVVVAGVAAKSRKEVNRIAMATVNGMRCILYFPQFMLYVLPS